MMRPDVFVNKTRERFMRAMILAQMGDRHSHRKCLEILTDLQTEIEVYEQSLNHVNMCLLSLRKDVANMRFEVARYLAVAA